MKDDKLKAEVEKILTIIQEATNGTSMRVMCMVMVDKESLISAHTENVKIIPAYFHSGTEPSLYAFSHILFKLFRAYCDANKVSPSDAIPEFMRAFFEETMVVSKAKEDEAKH